VFEWFTNCTGIIPQVSEIILQINTTAPTQKQEWQYKNLQPLSDRLPFTHMEDSWYSFLLEAESTPGPQYCWNSVPKL
jgi:hypothetical protein